MALTNAANKRKVAREQAPVPADELADPELNPLLNPVLEQNMGRWAQVYLTSPPEKRPQAVADLLRELREQDPKHRAHEGPQLAIRATTITEPARAVVPRETPTHHNAGTLNAFQRHGRSGRRFVLAGLVLAALGAFAYREWRSSSPRPASRPYLAVTSDISGSAARDSDAPVSAAPRKNRRSAHAVASQLAVGPASSAEHTTRTASGARIPHRRASAATKIFGAESLLPRLQIAEQPEGRFVYPAPPQAGLAGTVNLKVLIGTDGRIERATVLSGNRRLGDAAVRAVRHGRYSRHQLDGQPAEAETDVSISFFGADAVSIKFLP
jgi:TonB family protein